MIVSKKKEIVDNILELLIQLTEDEKDCGLKRTNASKMSHAVEMLTIKECKNLIHGISEHTIRKLVTQGKVKSVRTGEGKRGKILVNKDDLLTYFQN